MNVSVAVAPLPSATVRVIVEIPVCPLVGVTVTVRLPAAPLNVIEAFAKSARFDEVADTMRLPTGVSASPTVNANGPTAAPVLF